jgi:hypothetical protein
MIRKVDLEQLERLAEELCGDAGRVLTGCGGQEIEDPDFVAENLRAAAAEITSLRERNRKLRQGIRDVAEEAGKLRPRLGAILLKLQGALA